MTMHTMVGTEAHATRPGLQQRWYATVDIAMAGTDWHWQLVDATRRPHGSPSKAFPSEHEAMDNALSTLDGDEWE